VSGLALQVLQGLEALTVLARSIPLSQCQGRNIVSVRSPSGDGIGVYDKKDERMVVFDYPALVALASVEPAPPAPPPPTAPWVLDPPSKL